MDIAERKEALAALERNYALGVLKGRINGEEVQFADGADMARRIAVIKREIAALEAPASVRPRVFYPTFGRGV